MSKTENPMGFSTYLGIYRVLRTLNPHFRDNGLIPDTTFFPGKWFGKNINKDPGGSKSANSIHKEQIDSQTEVVLVDNSKLDGTASDLSEE